MVDFPSSVQLAMSHQTLGVGEQLPAQVALIVLLTRVHGQVLGEVERLTEHFATDFAGVRFLARVDTVVAPQGFSSSEAFSANLAAVRPLRPVPLGRGTPPPPHNSVRVPFFSRLSWLSGFHMRLAGVGKRHGGTVEAGRG